MVPDQEVPGLPRHGSRFEGWGFFLKSSYQDMKCALKREDRCRFRTISEQGLSVWSKETPNVHQLLGKSKRRAKMIVGTIPCHMVETRRPRMRRKDEDKPTRAVHCMDRNQGVVSLEPV